jgi:hypothetical protein
VSAFRRAQTIWLPADLVVVKDGKSVGMSALCQKRDIDRLLVELDSFRDDETEWTG